MKGRLVKRSHDLRDSDAALANLAWDGGAVELILVPEIDRHGRGTCRRPPSQF